MVFDPARYYRSSDLTEIATKDTLARWRHEGRGPAYVKAGGRILYPGKALNEWLEQQTIRPDEGP